MLYLRSIESVLCPEMAMRVIWGTPARRILRTPVLRRFMEVELGDAGALACVLPGCSEVLQANAIKAKYPRRIRPLRPAVLPVGQQQVVHVSLKDRYGTRSLALCRVLLERDQGLIELNLPPLDLQQVPTNADYGQALQQALQAGGYSPARASDLASQAEEQRATFGLSDTD